ncbi:MAG: class II aldolase/adducin family protein [Alphaproteobacteria bacterium]
MQSAQTITLDQAKVRHDLAKTINILAMLGMDDLTYTHVSARKPDNSGFFINPFGTFFENVTADSLNEIPFAGADYEHSKTNKTGYRIHGDIYTAREDVNCIIHLHSPATIAVSAHKQGLLPLSQFSLHFYNKLHMHEYDGLVLQESQGESLASDLKDGVGMLLRHHGSLTVGTTIQEAFFYTYYLEQACKTQIQILSQGHDNIQKIPAETCARARDQMRTFEPDLGRRDWDALVRKLDKA